MKFLLRLLFFLCLALLYSCKGGNNVALFPMPNATDTTCTDAQLAQLEKSMTSTLTGTTTDVDFTLLLESADGRTYTVSTGSSTAATLYDSASTAKLVTSVVILSLVDRGYLSLDSKPQDVIQSFWVPAPDNPASGITLRHLLNFTSGFYKEPPCLYLGSADFTSCVQTIYNNNIGNNIVPGTQFYYSGSHLQIAGLMAIKARGYDTWAEVFDEFRSNTEVFSGSTYTIPSQSNPLLAGGMRWKAEEYLAFLRKLYSGGILSDAMRAELWSNQRGSAGVVSSPTLSQLGEDWGYALGNWVECRSATFSCGTSRGRNSSPGAYGAYPFIDFESGYFGILARQGELGTFPQGVALFRTVENTAGKWATRYCGN